MVMYRGLGNDLALMDWLQKYIFPAEAKTVSPEFVRIGTRLAALEMIQSGTTTYADMYYFEEEVARVTKEAGLRGVLGQTVIEFPVPDAKTPADALKRAEAFAQAVRRRRADHAVDCAACGLHARRRDADGRQQPGEEVQHPAADPPGGNPGRDRHVAGAPQDAPRRAARQPEVLGADHASARMGSGSRPTRSRS